MPDGLTISLTKLKPRFPKPGAADPVTTAPANGPRRNAAQTSNATAGAIPPDAELTVVASLNAPRPLLTSQLKVNAPSQQTVKLPRKLKVPLKSSLLSLMKQCLRRKRTLSIYGVMSFVKSSALKIAYITLRPDPKSKWILADGAFKDMGKSSWKNPS